MFRDLIKPRKPGRSQGTPAPRAQLDTVLGGQSHFEGKLQCEGNVRVEGAFLGNITTKGKINIGEAAKVEGDLVGGAVSVSGTLRGDVTARRVYVTRAGRIWGDLTTQTLATEEGGFIQGLITMKESVDIDSFFPAEAQAPDEKADEGKPEPAKEAPQKTAPKR